MKPNWPKRKLGAVADLCLGKMLDQKKNKGDYHPYIGNIHVRWGTFDLDDLPQMRFESHERDRYGLKHGDLVVCEGGEPGRCALWKDQVPNMRFQKALHRVRPHPCLDSRYLLYWFLQAGKRNVLNQYCTGATIKHLPGEKLALVEVDVPPLPVQRKIASVLAAYDDLIENNTRRIKILERMAQALYREWFVHFRFPGHAKVKRVASPLGPIPQGWEVRRLDEVASVNASTIRRGHEPKNILYVDISSVGTGRIEKIEPMAFANAPGRARRIVRHGDTIWSCVRPNRKSFSLILDPPADLFVSTGFAVLTPAKVPFSFLHQAVTTDEFVGYLTNHATGAAYPAVTAKDFEAAELLVPDEPLLRLFHEHCEPTLLLKENLLRKNATLRRTRDLLLPRLLGGQIELRPECNPT